MSILKFFRQQRIQLYLLLAIMLLVFLIWSRGERVDVFVPPAIPPGAEFDNLDQIERFKVDGQLSRELLAPELYLFNWEIMIIDKLAKTNELDVVAVLPLSIVEYMQNIADIAFPRWIYEVEILDQAQLKLSLTREIQVSESAISEVLTLAQNIRLIISFDQEIKFIALQLN